MTRPRLVAELLVLNLVAIAVVVPLGLNSAYADPSLHFGEGLPMTWISVFQLLGIAYLAERVYRQRRCTTELGWSDACTVWRIVSGGFVFLALDELLQIHEMVDPLIHAVLGMAETGLSDRLDDLIVGLYGLAGLLVLRRYRAEVLRYGAAAPYFVGGFLIFAVMVALDATTNRLDVLGMLIADGQALEGTLAWMGVLEDSLKNIAEVMFIAALVRCASVARRLEP